MDDVPFPHAAPLLSNSSLSPSPQPPGSSSSQPLQQEHQHSCKDCVLTTNIMKLVFNDDSQFKDISKIAADKTQIYWELDTSLDPERPTVRFLVAQDPNLDLLAIPPNGNQNESANIDKVEILGEFQLVCGTDMLFNMDPESTCHHTHNSDTTAVDTEKGNGAESPDISCCYVGSAQHEIDLKRSAKSRTPLRTVQTRKPSKMKKPEDQSQGPAQLRPEQTSVRPEKPTS